MATIDFRLKDPISGFARNVTVAFPVCEGFHLGIFLLELTEFLFVEEEQFTAEYKRQRMRHKILLTLQRIRLLFEF